MADHLRFIKPTNVFGVSLDCSGCNVRVVVPRGNQGRENFLAIDMCPACEKARVSHVGWGGSQDPWKNLMAVFTVLSEWEARGISLVFEEKEPDGDMKN